MDNIITFNTRIVSFSNLALNTLMTNYNNLNFNSRWRSYSDDKGIYCYARASATTPHNITFPYAVNYIKLTMFYYAAGTNTISVNGINYVLNEIDKIITLKERITDLNITINTDVANVCLRNIIYS